MKDVKVYDGSGWQSLKGPPGPSEPSADGGNFITAGSDGRLYLTVEQLISQSPENIVTVGDDGGLYATVPPTPLDEWEAVLVSGNPAWWMSREVQTEYGPAIQRRLVVAIAGIPDGATVGNAFIALPTTSTVYAGQGLFVQATANLQVVGKPNGTAPRVSAYYATEVDAASGGSSEDAVAVVYDFPVPLDSYGDFYTVVDITYIEAVT